MSTRAILREQVDNGALVPFDELLPGSGCQRTLLLSREVADEIEGDVWVDPDLARRYAFLVADLQRFSSGAFITLGLDPYQKGKGAYMARIDPVRYGIWSIRSRDPKPSLRVLGAFAMKDTFVCLQSHRREDLDGPGGPRWAKARENAISVWEQTLIGLPRLTGESIDDFVSQAIESV